MQMYPSITRMMTSARKARVSGQAMGLLAKRGESPLESPSPFKRMSTKVDDTAKEKIGKKVFLCNGLPLEEDPEKEEFFRCIRSERSVIKSGGFEKVEFFSPYCLYKPTPIDNEVELKIVSDIAKLGIKEYNRKNKTGFKFIRVKHCNHALEYNKVRTMQNYITFIAKERGNEKEFTFQAKGYGGRHSAYKPTLEFVRLKKVQ